PHLAVRQAAALRDFPTGPRQLARPIVPVIRERAVPRRVAEEREHMIGGVADEVLVVLAHGDGCTATPVPRSSDAETSWRTGLRSDGGPEGCRNPLHPLSGL